MGRRSPTTSPRKPKRPPRLGLGWEYGRDRDRFDRCARAAGGDGGMMASTNMDEATSETEPVASGVPQVLEDTPEATEFDATPWPVPTRPAPRPLKLSRPLGPRMWTAALAAALVFTTGGLAPPYLADTTFQKTAGQLSADNQSLNSQNKDLQSKLH